MQRPIKNLICVPAWIAVLTAWTPVPSGAIAQPSVIQTLLDASHSVVAVTADNGILRKGSIAKWTRRGAGIIIHASGLIATNAHTVNQAARLTVTLADERRFRAAVVFLDAASDLALVKIEAAAPLAALRLGDSDKLVLRSAVYSIGSSELIKNTLSEGRLTGIGVARGKARGSSGPQARLLQVSFNVYPGDSGSPVFNAAGEVIGIISAGAPRRGRTAFAIPSNFISRASAL